MIVNFKNDYKKAVEGLDEKVRKNGAFNLNFQYIVEDRLREGASLDIEVLNNGKTVRMIDKPTTCDFYGHKSAYANVIDVNLQSDDGIEVLKSRGDITDASYFYRIPTATPINEKDIHSVLSVSYIRSVYDKDGIEMQTTNYTRVGIPCSNVLYSDRDSMLQLLLSAGNIMPLFYDNKTEIPTNSIGAILETITRDKDNPSIAIKTRIERGKSAELDDIAITNYSMGYVNSSWPEILVFRNEEAFADYIDDGWEIRKSGLRGGGESLEEIIDACTKSFDAALERSNSKKCGSREYLALRERVDKLLEQQKEEKGPVKVK